MDKEQMIKAGGKLWAKNSIERVYFNQKQAIAKLFNLAVVETVSGAIPAGFDGMIKAGKTKSFFDLKSNALFADSGDIANAGRANNLKVRKL